MSDGYWCAPVTMSRALGRGIGDAEHLPILHRSQFHVRRNGLLKPFRGFVAFGEVGIGERALARRIKNFSVAHLDRVAPDFPLPARKLQSTNLALPPRPGAPMGPCAAWSCCRKCRRHREPRPCRPSAFESGRPARRVPRRRPATIPSARPVRLRPCPSAP